MSDIGANKLGTTLEERRIGPSKLVFTNRSHLEVRMDRKHYDSYDICV